MRFLTSAFVKFGVTPIVVNEVVRGQNSSIYRQSVCPRTPCRLQLSLLRPWQPLGKSWGIGLRMSPFGIHPRRPDIPSPCRLIPPGTLKGTCATLHIPSNCRWHPVRIPRLPRQTGNADIVSQLPYYQMSERLRILGRATSTFSLPNSLHNA